MLNLEYMSSTPPPANHMFHRWCVLPDFSYFAPLKSWEVLDGSFVFVCVCGGGAGGSTPGWVCVFLNHVPGSESG